MITELSMSNFRGHTRTLVFGPKTNFIKGKNEAGKSSIKEAIAFTWMGTDSEGSRNPDHLITVGEDVAETHIKTPKATVKRRKRRGGTSEVKLGVANIPDIKLSQTDLMNKLGLSFEVFMSCWNVGYFMKLDAKAKLKVLGEIAKLDRRTLLMSLLPEGTELPTQIKLVNPRIDADAVAGMRRQLQNKLTSTQGSLQQIDLQMGNIKQPQTHFNLSENERALAEVEAALSDWNLYDQLLSKYKTDLVRYQTAGQRHQELTSELQAKHVTIKEMEENYRAGKSRADELQAKIEANKQLLAALPAKMRKVTLPIPQRPSLATGDCSMCGQPITVEHKEKVEAAYQAALLEYNMHERDVANHNQPIIEEDARLSKEQMAFMSEEGAIRARMAEWVKSGKELRERITQIEKSLQETNLITNPTAPVQPEVDRDSFAKLRDELKLAIHDYKLATTQLEQLQKQRESYVNQAATLEQEIEAHSKIEQALLQLPHLETQKTLETVSVPGVSISLEDGELIVKDEKGVDYRCLSDGRRMKTDIKLALAIQAGSGPAAPKWLFVDNADLMDQSVAVEEGVQLLVASVDPEAHDVTVVQI